MPRAAAAAAEAVAAREAETRVAEGELMGLERQRRVDEHWAKGGGKHSQQALDVLVLATQHGAFTWTAPADPPMNGQLPRARMAFTAHYAPQMDRVIVWGGCQPTTTEVALADSHVYVLHLRSMRWTRPVVRHSMERMDSQIHVRLASLSD
jgi:hypothetical protein